MNVGWNLFKKSKNINFLSMDGDKDYYVESKDVANLNEMSGEDFEIFFKRLIYICRL